jgi:pimeloyl-ACP methyl ester carboxylesterase
MKKTLKLVGGFVLLVLIIGAAGFIVWASNPLGPMPEALTALESDDLVTVSTTDWLVFEPTNVSSSTGLIFYPGGRVDYRSYAPLARLVALHGYRVFIVPMPLNLAVFAPNRAAEVIAANPDIDTWAITGHSLGGAMAANFVDANPQALAAILFLAAYPADSDDLSASSITAASIYGLLDGVAPPDQIESSALLLPEMTEWFPIDGGNHAQFGWYGDQPGDNIAEITREEQQSAVLAAILKILQQLPVGNPQVYDRQTASLHTADF